MSRMGHRGIQARVLEILREAHGGAVPWPRHTLITLWFLPGRGSQDQLPEWEELLAVPPGGALAICVGPGANWSDRSSRGRGSDAGSPASR